jgi:Tfp pilus assembly PilM family ATPase
MKGTERYLAFIIERSHVTAVEIAHSPKGKTLTAAGSFDSSINFDDPSIYAEAGSIGREKTFVREIQAFMKKIGAGAHFFSFGLNSQMAMVQTIPVEMSLSDEEFATHLEWELANYFPEAVPEQYIITPYALVGDDGTPSDRAMVISVRKSFLNFLNSVCDKLHGSLHIVDIDHFCAETCLTFSFPTLAAKRTVVIGMDEETLDASLLVGGKNADIRTMKWNGDDFSLIDAYAKERRADIIYLHGRMVTPAIAQTLKQHTPYQVELADPFRKVALPATLKNIEEIKNKKQEYTAAVGLAVRDDS